ncbi:MAG: hypothetical protein KGJ07_09765, partial [Patescibacteria group bacterium]|nr:hypothetical protein [Patescibacteria group bacterium]
MHTVFHKLPENPTKTGFREMQIYELVRQAADAWNIPLEQVVKFQEWWDNGKTDELARSIVPDYISLSSQEKQFGHRFSQYYQHHMSYTLPEIITMPNVNNLIDIAQYYLADASITVPHFVITIVSQQLIDIAELGESVLVLTGEENNEIGKKDLNKKKNNRSF